MKKATRESYGEKLEEIGNRKEIVVFDADLSTSTKTAKFGNKYPERFFNVGISEQDMVCQAAGMASKGKTVFASSFAAFLIGRAYDQIRASIGYSNLNVKLVSTHAGLTLGEDGATHQMLEDIAMMRAMPNFEVYTASTDRICKKIVEKISENSIPTYLRLYRMEVEECYDNIKEEDMEKIFEIGMVVKPAERVEYKKHDVILITMGDMIEKTIRVQKSLIQKGINALVIDVFRLKPFNDEMIVKIFNDLNNAKIVTIEDHSIYGGLGSIISDVMTNLEKEVKQKRTVLKLGTKEFGKSGKPNEVLEKFGLDEKTIEKTVLEYVKK